MTFTQRADAVKANGGNAVPGVTRINQVNVVWTYNAFIKEFRGELGLSRINHAMIGSAGKKAPNETSGDIDIAIRFAYRHRFNDMPAVIIQTLTEKGYAFKDMRQIGIISLAYPISSYDDKQDGEFVQIDLMIVESLGYAKWAYYSPAYNQSPYKGLYRNEVNFAIAKFAKLELLEVVDDEPVTWSRYWWSNSHGLFKGTETKKSPKTGKIIKTRTVLNKEHVTQDPDEVVKFLYGSQFNSDEILTFEDALEAIHSQCFPYKDELPFILDAVLKGIEAKGYPIPDILMDCFRKV